MTSLSNNNDRYSASYAARLFINYKSSSLDIIFLDLLYFSTLTGMHNCFVEIKESQEKEQPADILQRTISPEGSAKK